MRYRADLPADSAIRRILIIKWSAMGDVVLATALFEDIAQAFPGRDLHLNTLPAWRELFAQDARFKHVFAIDLRDPCHQAIAFSEWLRRVRSQHYDLVIDLQCNDRSRLLLSLLWLSGCRIPYCLGNRQQLPYNIAPAELPRPAHTIDRSRAALQAGNIPATTRRPVLHIPDSHHAHARELMAANHLLPDQFAIFLPGCNANGYLKRWGAARYAALANRLHQEGLAHIVLIGGPDEREECQSIAQACGSWLVNLCGQTAIFDIPALCQPACFIVANDTGAAHLAAVTPTPILVLCGPTDPRRVKPLGDNVSTLQANLPCINCYRKTCLHHTCMTMLTPPLVFRHLQELVR
jgi:heptosyltransferase-2